MDSLEKRDRRAPCSLIYTAIAVVVLAIGELRGTEVDGAVTVVAVGATGDIASRLSAVLCRDGSIAVAITIAVPIPGGPSSLIRTAIAVVVLAIAELRGTRVDSVVTVAAVGVIRDIA
jgi:ribosome-binding factor A